MKEKRILDALEHIDEDFIEDAAPGMHKVRKPVWIRWAAAAACLCLAAAGIFALGRPGGTIPGVSDDLPLINIPEYRSGGMGFEGLMYYSAEELEKEKSGNPWREDMALDTLPVFRNGSYDPSGAGLPVGLSEAEMNAELEKAAEALGLRILDTEAETNAEKSDDGQIIPGDAVWSIRAITGNGSLRVYAYGSLVYDLPDGFKLPEGYNFTYYDTSDPEAEAVMAYLTETYASFLGFDHPKIVLQGDRTFSGDYGRRYLVYDAAADMTERILNYNFRAAQFAPDDDGELMLIRLSDGLCKAEKLGDYPLITLAEAKEKLLNGQYQTSVPAAMPGEEYIAKAELVYRSGPSEENLLPYYRFYAELQDADILKMTQSSGLKIYGAYYVPAIRDEYISNMSTYSGHFN